MRLNDMMVEVYDDSPMCGHHLVGRWTIDSDSLALILEQLKLHGKAMNPVARGFESRIKPKLTSPVVEDYPSDVNPPEDLEDVPRMEP